MKIDIQSYRVGECISIICQMLEQKGIPCHNETIIKILLEYDKDNLHYGIHEEDLVHLLKEIDRIKLGE